jgi:hypothetical protein
MGKKSENVAPQCRELTDGIGHTLRSMTTLYPPTCAKRVAGSIRVRGGDVTGVIATEFSCQVRPELLQDIGSHVDAELHTELRYGLRSSPVVRIVSHRNCHRS